MTYKGVSGFAVMNKRFPFERFMQQYPKDIEKPFLPVLYGVFGKRWKNIKHFCAMYQDRPHLLEFHLCFRTPDPKVVKYAAKISKKMRKIGNANTRVLICPVLEDQMSNVAWRRLATKVELATHYPLVRCPIASPDRGGEYLERHGRDPAFTRPQDQCIANPDGVSIDLRDGETYFNQMSIDDARTYMQRQNGVHAIALWLANQQGLGSGTGWGGVGAPPPKKRNFIVTDQAIKHIKELLDA